MSKTLRITKARSQVFRKDGILFIPILHPSAALRAPETMLLFLEDLANLRGFLGREIAEAEITDMDEGKVRGVCPPPTDAPEEGGNLSLF